MKPFALLMTTLTLTATLAQAPAMAADDIESPKFEVALTGDAAELRRYAPMIAAEVRVEADDLDSAGSMGFMPLANYIFGNNKPGERIQMTAPVTAALVTSRDSLSAGAGEKIAMTAPVTTEPVRKGVYAVRFMMPSKWTMDTLPAPDDARVSLIETPETYFVAAGFMGAKDQAAIDAAEAAIRAFVAENGLTPAGETTLAGYSSPFTPVAQRKWEVLLKVDAPG